MRSKLKAAVVCGCTALLITLAVLGSSASGQTKLKVALVSDIGGLNDKSFNQLAYTGLKRAKAKLGVDIKVLTSKSAADYTPNLTSLAQDDYDLIIGAGFLMTDNVATVAKAFPDVKFAIIDVDATTLKGKPKNVTGLLFKEQEAGYLVGYLAGLYAKDKGIKAVSSVGGVKIPSVDRYIAGYQAGAKKAYPGITVLNGYSQDFVKQDKCKEVALNQIAKGSGVVFQVAGGCGLGALDAAKSKKLAGIGVDADQGYLGSYILTSALKKVDQAVYDSIASVKAGTLKGGVNVTATVKGGGVGYGKLGPAAKKYAGKIATIAKRIKAGTIKNIPATVK